MLCIFQVVTDHYHSFIVFLVGQLYIYGLALRGADGVKHIVKTILADLEVTMGLSGYKNIDEFRGKANEVLVRVE